MGINFCHLFLIRQSYEGSCGGCVDGSMEQGEDHEAPQGWHPTSWPKAGCRPRNPAEPRHWGAKAGRYPNRSTLTLSTELVKPHQAGNAHISLAMRKKYTRQLLKDNLSPLFNELLVLHSRYSTGYLQGNAVQTRGI